MTQAWIGYSAPNKHRKTKLGYLTSSSSFTKVARDTASKTQVLLTNLPLPRYNR